MPLLRSTLREVYADLALMEDAVGVGQTIGIASGRRYRSTP